MPAPFTPPDLSAYYQQNALRVPQGAALEQASSDSIAGLLNPPSMFPDVARMSAERGAAVGVPGSPNAFSVGLKMSDDERLKRIALGQQFLSGAYARNPALPPEFSFLTAGQNEQSSQADRILAMDEDKLKMQQRASELENQLKALQIRNIGGNTGEDLYRNYYNPPPKDTRITGDPLVAYKSPRR